MSIWSKVFIGFVFVAGLGFFYFAARTLKTHDEWRSSAKGWESQIAKTKEEARKLIEGDPDAGKPSLAQLKIDLHAVVSDRGRAWYHVVPSPIPANAGELAIVVTVDANANQIKPQAMLYVFDERSPAEGGRYLGQFRVTAVADTQVTLTPAVAGSLSDRDYRKLQNAATGQWAMYESMPRDGHDVFDHLNEEQLRALLPASQPMPGDDPAVLKLKHDELIKDYLASGEKPDADSPPSPNLVMVGVKFVKNDAPAKESLRQVIFPSDVVPNDRLPPEADQKAMVDKMFSRPGEVFEFEQSLASKLVEQLKIAEEVERRYRRPLVDFALAFNEYERQLPLTEDRIAAWSQDLKHMQDPNTGAETDATGMHLPFVEAEKASLIAEKTKMLKERDLAAKRQKAMGAALAKTKKQVVAVRAENRKLAAQLSALQFEAAERAEEASLSDQARAGNQRGLTQRFEILPTDWNFVSPKAGATSAA